jgi:hypothetical protein
MTNSQKVLAAVAARFGTQDPNQLQIQRWQYYDFVRLNVAGTNRLSFFSNPIGAVDPVSALPKTLEETNVRRSGELDLPFAILQIRTQIDILPMSRQPAGVAAVTDGVVQGLTAVHKVLRGMAEQGVMSLEFGQKNYFQIFQPFQKCPPGYGPSLTAIAANGAGAFPPESSFYAQSVDPRDSYAVSPPLFVEKSQTFQAVIDFFLANTPVIPQVGGANVAINVGVILDGYVVRPVQ